MKISKMIRNVPLGEINNMCVLYDLELNVKEEEVVLFDIKIEEEMR